MQATIWRDDLEALVELGFLVAGPGCADHHITELGRAALAASLAPLEKAT